MPSHEMDDERSSGQEPVARRVPEGGYTASATTSSRQPQDWGRALAIALHSLADQAREHEDDPIEQALLGAHVDLAISAVPDGVEIRATWTKEQHGDAPQA